MMLIKPALPAFTSSEKSCSERFTSCAQQTLTVRPFLLGEEPFLKPNQNRDIIKSNLGVLQRLFEGLAYKAKDECSTVAGLFWVHR